MARPNGPRIRTLDSWRGVAILPVVLDHASANSRYDQMLWARRYAAPAFSTYLLTR
jgi:peptidoglycan/LPS O-acetylase OafA/YrhL